MIGNMYSRYKKIFKKNDKNKKTFVIAEVGQAHEGSLSIAKSYIDAIAEAGADAVKFQTHYANEESTLDETFRIKFSSQDKTRFDYWKRMEFSPKMWAELKKYSNKKKLLFLSSPFSVKAVEILNKIGVPFWKLASGEFESLDIINAMIKTKKPIFVSTGMMTDKDILLLKNKIGKKNFALFQCTSMYPLPLNKVGINLIQDFKSKYNCPVGLSDHTGNKFTSIYAIASKADFIEVHVTLSKKIFNPDTESSLTPSELKDVCDARDNFYILRKHIMHKNKLSKNLLLMKKKFGKSLALKNDIKKNQNITLLNLSFKKPGTGLKSNLIKYFLNKKAKKNISSQRLLKKSDVY